MSTGATGFGSSTTSSTTTSSTITSSTASAGSSSTAGGSSTGGSLQRRLIKSDLMPLAEADADPAAAALAAWLASGDGAAAVTVLLSRMLAAQLLDGLDPTLGMLGPADPVNADAGGLGESQGVRTGAGGLSSPTASPPGARPANGAQSPLPQQQQQQQGADGSSGAKSPRHTQPPSPSPAVLAQLPLLLHWVMSVGLDLLGGRLVSGGLLTVLHRMALRVARCAEVSGLPVAAAEALALADAIGDPSASSSSSSGGCGGYGSSSSGSGGDLLGEVLMLMWHARLAAAVLALQLLPDGGSNGGSCGSNDGSSGSSSWDVAYWQAAVAKASPLLQRMGLKVEPEAVAVVLARHALALNPVLELPAEPPGYGWCWELPQAYMQNPQQQQQLLAAAGDAAAAGGGAGAGAYTPRAGRGVFGGSGSNSSQAMAAAIGSGPDAVLAVCLSRTSSLTAAASAVASSTLLSRVGSLAAPSAAAAAAAGGVKGAAGQPGLGPAIPAAAGGKGHAAAAGGGAVSTGHGWGAQHGGSSSSSDESVASVLGVSWELARQSGDKLAAVSVCSGAQFSCCLQQQQQQQQQQHGPHAYADNTGRGAAGSPTTPQQRMSQPGRGLVRPRPVIFATKGAGMCPAELLAPPNLLSVWTASRAYHQHSSRKGSALSTAAGGVTAGSSPRHQQQQQRELKGGSTAAAGSSPSSALSPASPYAAASAGSLSGFMSQVLDQLRWPPDPWVVGEYPTRRSGSSLGSAAVGHVQSVTVAAHPNRPLFVSGSSTGRIYLWQFGEANCKAAYVPLASTAQVRIDTETGLLSPFLAG